MFIEHYIYEIFIEHYKIKKRPTLSINIIYTSSSGVGILLLFL